MQVVCYFGIFSDHRRCGRRITAYSAQNKTRQIPPPQAELTDGYSKIANTTNELAGQASVMSGGPHLIFNFAASEIYRSHTFPQTEQTPGCPVSHHTGVHDRNHVIVIQ